ncbi:MAG: universal stress protein [Anaerolineales bacterium]|nr:universal stress protein [Anaerolineales bacterium]
MFKHILVPLDGSHFAEMALPYARVLSEKFNAKLTLACVVETPIIFGDEFVATANLQAAARETALAETHAYLMSKQGEMRQLGYDVDFKLVEGRLVAEQIIELACLVAADVIVMSTHGRSGIGRWLLGSVADKVLRQANVPVLLIRAQEEQEPLTWRTEQPVDEPVPEPAA